MADTGRPSGYTCQCGHYNRFSEAVHTNWGTEFTHVCPGCGRTNTLISGNLVYVSPDMDEIEQDWAVDTDSSPLPDLKKRPW